MVEIVTFENAYLYGDVISSLFRLRYKAFVKRQSYDVPTFKDMEYDKYDNLSTSYLVWRDEHGVVRGTSRKAPTDRDYMIKDIWPEMVSDIDLPTSANIWESSRFCVDQNLNKTDRKKIIGDLACAGLEFGVQNEIEYFIGVMPPMIWKFVFVNSGWPVEFIGDITRLGDGSKIVAAKMPVSRENLKNVREVMGITGSILENRSLVEYHENFNPILAEAV